MSRKPAASSLTMPRIFASKMTRRAARSLAAVEHRCRSAAASSVPRTYDAGAWESVPWAQPQKQLPRGKAGHLRCITSLNMVM